MSHMSIGSLSPQHPVSLSWWLGSSHVCEDRKTHLKDGRGCVGCCGGRTCLWNSSIVPDVAFVRKDIRYISKIPLLRVLFQWIKRLFGSYLTKDMTQRQLIHPQISSEVQVRYERGLFKLRHKSQPLDGDR